MRGVKAFKLPVPPLNSSQWIVDYHPSAMRCLGGAVILTGFPHPR